MSDVLLTQEVGSLAKPNWRVAAVVDKEITLDHVQQARTWADRLGFDPIEVEDILCQSRIQIRENGKLAADKKAEIKLLAARFAVRLQEKAGLDIIYDGEQDRSEMYQYAVARTNGFDLRGSVRAFDNRWYKKYAAVDEPAITKPWHTEEVSRLQSLTTKRIKVPVTGAYTLADWSFDEFYGNKQELVGALARNVIRPNLIGLLAQGVEWVQIDEPAAGTKADEAELIVAGFNEATKGLVGKFSMHLCYSDWDRLFPEFENLENCHQFSMEFANRDNQELGRSENARPAYSVLSAIRRAAPRTSIGLGVVSIHEDRLETPDLIRDRILRAVDIVGDPNSIFPSPDCGLRTRSWEVAYEKLSRVVEGTQLAKQVLA